MISPDTTMGIAGGQPTAGDAQILPFARGRMASLGSLHTRVRLLHG